MPVMGMFRGEPIHKSGEMVVADRLSLMQWRLPTTEQVSTYTFTFWVTLFFTAMLKK